MSLITAEELARGLLIGTFGGAAGLCTLAFPGSALWLVPAGLAVGGCALTIPEVRQEAVKALPYLESARRALPAPDLPALADRMRRALPVLPGQGAPAGAPAARRPAAPDPLIETLENTPHRLIIGHTRGGKTTLIHHMATDWAAAGERVLVADPDAAPGLWPGCEVWGHGDNVIAIGGMLDIVADEVTARRAARAQGVRRFPPLHVVIDEAQDVLPALDGGLELFEDVARRGGKLNIRMTVGVQDKQVKTLGLQGKSEVLRNLQVADVLKNREGRRVAVLRDAETGKKITYPIPLLTDPETLIIAPPAAAARPAAPVSKAPTVSNQEAADLLSSLFAEAVSSASGRTDTVAPVSVSVSNAMDTDTDTDTPPATVSMRLGADGHHLTVNVNARAEAAPAAGRGRPRRGHGLDMRRRRQMVQAAQGDAHKAELQQAYETRKAAGMSYRKAYAELGGNGEETRVWWRAASEPQEKKQS